MIQYGGFWRRFVAALIDGIILNIALSIIMSIFGVGAGFAQFGDPAYLEAAGVGAVLLLIVISFGGQWLYFALMESSSMQATLGKLAMGVVVADAKGERISFGRATGRYFAKILSGMILMIGYIMAAFTERKQALHDLLAGTVVYKTRDPSSVRSSADIFA